MPEAFSQNSWKRSCIRTLPNSEENCNIYATFTSVYYKILKFLTQKKVYICKQSAVTLPFSCPMGSHGNEILVPNGLKTYSNSASVNSAHFLKWVKDIKGLLLSRAIIINQCVRILIN
jgi:hypothetical protein